MFVSTQEQVVVACELKETESKIRANFPLVILKDVLLKSYQNTTSKLMTLLRRLYQNSNI